MKTITCEFVEVTSLVPENWTSWFWTTISESAPLVGETIIDHWYVLVIF